MRTNFFWWLLSVLLISCVSTADRPIPSLLRADSLIQEGCADCALILLETINPSSLYSESSKAWYALLMTQAKDENYIVHTNDSLIRIAADYFDATDDILQQAKAHYYWGRVSQDCDDVEGAVRKLLTAIPLAVKAENYDLNVLSLSNLGLLCWENGLLKEADSLYKHTIELAGNHNDSLHLVMGLVKRADICMENKDENYTDAEIYLKRALKLVEKSDNLNDKDAVYRSLSYLYAYQEKPLDAISCAMKGMTFEPDTLRRQGYYFIIGSAYTQLGQYDSAYVYLNKCLSSKNYYTKANTYMRLSEIADTLGKSKEALIYARQYIAYKDSMKMQEQPVKLISSLKDILHYQSKEYLKSSLFRSRFYLLVIVLVFILAISFFIQKRRQKKRVILSIIEKSQALYANVILLRQKLADTKKKIANLRLQYLELEANEAQHKQMNDCLKKLIEKQTATQINLELQLKERNIEVEHLRNMNPGYVLSSSPIYTRLCDLCDYNRKNPDKIQKLTSQEWESLIYELDSVSLAFVERLRSKYERLLEDDIHFCCLVKLDFKYSDIAHIWGCTPVAVHKRSKSILGKMEIGDNIKLKDILVEV